MLEPFANNLRGEYARELGRSQIIPYAKRRQPVHV
jgi:hypothetical protein